MGLFANLHDAGQVMADLVAERTGVADVLVGTPIDPPTGPGEAIRITLMWVTPQPTHRNDPAELDGIGGLTPPPVTVAAYFMVTTYGTAPDTDPIQGYNLLGQVLQAFHGDPVLDLPLTFPGVVPLGTGRLSVVHVPTAADLMEKMFSPLQIRHRPWALFEAGPLQLASLAAPGAEPPIVHPGGIRLGEIESISPPVIERITPEAVAVGGRIRLDVRTSGAPVRVSIGDVRVEAVDLSIPMAGGPIFVDLPVAPGAEVEAGSYDVTLTVGRLVSEPSTLTVSGLGAGNLDAPLPAAHSLAGGDLLLSGVGLGTTSEVYFWPDAGLQAPDEIHAVAPAAPPVDGSVVIAAADLQAAGVPFTHLKVSARVAEHRFTSPVLLELVP